MDHKGENIYLRKDHRWEGRYHKGRKANGRLKYGYIYGKTYEEVKEKLLPLKSNSENLLLLHGKSTITFFEWVESCWHRLIKGLKPATISSYNYKVDTYLFPYIGELSLFEINSDKVTELFQTWREKGLKDSSCNVISRLLTKILKEAQRAKILENDCCSSLPKIKIKSQKINALSNKEQHQLEKASMKYPDSKGLSVLLALQTGLRIGEISALKWTDIDFASQLISVRHTIQRVSHPEGGTQLNYGSAKTQASQRIIPMTRKVFLALKKLRKQSSSAYVFSVNGKPCESRLFTYHFHHIRKIAHLDQVHFHQLRHTFATRCLETSSDVSSVSAIMGHASTQMTLDIYADSLLDQRWLVIKNLNE